MPISVGTQTSSNPFLLGRLAVIFFAVYSTIAGAAPTIAGVESDADKSLKAIHVGYGITKVRLTADGLNGLLIRGRRDNGNAHGFDVLSIYALAQSPERAADFLVVSVWGVGNAGNDQERLELTASGGADCKLDDFRFFVGPGRDLQLITAQRAPGTSFTDIADVTFTYFKLKSNSAVDSGRPLYYFESTTSSKAKKPYCDVDAAFEQELGIGRS